MKQSAEGIELDLVELVEMLAHDSSVELLIHKELTDVETYVVIKKDGVCYGGQFSVEPPNTKIYLFTMDDSEALKT